MRTFLILLLVLACTAPLSAERPPKKIDLGQFPAETMDNVVIPVPSEIFAVLDKLGNPNWREEFGSVRTFPPTGNRAQDALLLGSIIADGFIAVEAEDSELVKGVGRNVLTLAEAIGVRKSVVSRSNSIIEKADAHDWNGVRRELDGALQDVSKAMTELNDEQLAQLVSIGGWLRGTQTLTSIVKNKYSRDRAELLHQPMLVNLFTQQLDAMSPRLRRNPLVNDTQSALTRINPLIGQSNIADIPPEAVNEIYEITTEMVNLIRSNTKAS